MGSNERAASMRSARGLEQEQRMAASTEPLRAAAERARHDPHASGGQCNAEQSREQ
jgi:hypothetical protein